MPTLPIMSDLSPVTFAAHGEYFVCGGTRGIQVWRVDESQPMTAITVEQVQCVAYSKDGKWIAAGTYRGNVMIWDTNVYKQVHATWNIDAVVRGVDFSSDSARLCAWGDNTTTVWDIASRERAIAPLRHEDRVWAAKYSPQRSQIATATQNYVRVYERNRDPVDIPVQVATHQYNTALLWSNKLMFVISESRIKQIDPSSWKVVSEWVVPESDNYSCIAMPKHGQFIAYSANRTVTFWDTSTHTQLGVVHHNHEIYSVALSQDGRFLAIGEEDGKIAIKRLSRITEPGIEINDAALRSRKRGSVTNVEELLAEAIPAPRNARHNTLAGRALVRARLEQWDEAAVDAEESNTAQPSVMGFIAKSILLVNNGEKHEAYRTCDIAFEHTHSTHISFLLLVKAVIVCMAGEYDDAISRVGDLIATLNLNSVCFVVQAYMRLLLGNSLMDSGDFDGAIRSFKRARGQLRHHTSRALSLISLISGWNFDDLDTMSQQGLCEALYVAGRTNEAGEILHMMVNTIGEERGPITDWAFDFLQRYLSTSGSSMPLLKVWAKLKLTRYSWKDALNAAVPFLASRFTIYQTICEQLDTLNKIMDATKCFHDMMDELSRDTDQDPEHTEWVIEFKAQLFRKLEYLGDGAMHAERYDEAISDYSAALSLDPTSPQGLLIKRSRAYVARGLWQDGLSDANEAIALDRESPWGYERKHAALHSAGRYDDAILTFETMLMKISQSPDPKIRERQHDYVKPVQTNAAIRKTVQDTIRDSPRVLIHTATGRLYDKSKQASWFESLTVFKELISSMTTHIDHDHIQQKVAEYYRYATFSHTWEDGEPSFEQVVQIVVYELDESRTHNKLQMFCKIARDSGLYWAWSDTCCINKSDHFVLQEALVAMFKWFEGSAVTIVFLRGVHSPSRRGDLMRSMWNTRGWTLQEYHASKVVRFYTEDWTPYLNLDIDNHKESPEIISEMKEATGISAQFLMSLRPGLQDIREKLCLASRRETTFVEDAAYSLLGIFAVSLPIVYGEGDQALGRLLAQLVTSSGDASVLAWTGKSGSFNSSLPASITVFSELATSHIPLADSGTEATGSTKRSSSPNFTLVMELFDRLHELPVPSFANQRMRLPCLTFKLGPVKRVSGDVFRARTEALGVVEIKTTEDLSQYGSLTLVHPWIDYLLDRHPVDNMNKTISEDASHRSSPSDLRRWRSNTFDTAQALVKQARLISRIGQTLSVSDTISLRSPLPVSSKVKRTQALGFIARLRQPFGALLFTPKRHHVEEYRRVASENQIRVQVEELSSTVLSMLIKGARSLDVL